MILITGAMGNVGGRLARGLAPVIRVDRVAGADIVVDLEAGDFDETGLTEALGRARAVVHMGSPPDPHLPAEVHLGASWGTMRLVRACMAAGVPRLVLASSNWAEPAPPLTLNAYGRSKRIAENLAEMYSDLPGCTGVAVRVGWVPTPDQDPEAAEDWLRDSYWNEARLVAEVSAALGIEGRDAG